MGRYVALEQAFSDKFGADNAFPIDDADEIIPFDWGVY